MHHKQTDTTGKNITALSEPPKSHLTARNIMIELSFMPCRVQTACFRQGCPHRAVTSPGPWDAYPGSSSNISVNCFSLLMGDLSCIKWSQLKGGTSEHLFLKSQQEYTGRIPKANRLVCCNVLTSWPRSEAPRSFVPIFGISDRAVPSVLEPSRRRFHPGPRYQAGSLQSQRSFFSYPSRPFSSGGDSEGDD